MPTPEDDESRGIRCPHCNCGHNKITNTIPYEFNWNGKLKRTIRRRHLCRYCKESFTTVEHIEANGHYGIPDVDATPDEPNPFPSNGSSSSSPKKNPFLPPLE